METLDYQERPQSPEPIEAPDRLSVGQPEPIVSPERDGVNPPEPVDAPERDPADQPEPLDPVGRAEPAEQPEPLAAPDRGPVEQPEPIAESDGVGPVELPEPPERPIHEGSANSLQLPPIALQSRPFIDGTRIRRIDAQATAGTYWL